MIVLLFAIWSIGLFWLGYALRAAEAQNQATEAYQRGYKRATESKAFMEWLCSAEEGEDK